MLLLIIVCFVNYASFMIVPRKVLEGSQKYSEYLGSLLSGQAPGYLQNNYFSYCNVRYFNGLVIGKHADRKSSISGIRSISPALVKVFLALTKGEKIAFIGQKPCCLEYKWPKNGKRSKVIEDAFAGHY